MLTEGIKVPLDSAACPRKRKDTASPIRLSVCQSHLHSCSERALHGSCELEMPVAGVTVLELDHIAKSGRNFRLNPASHAIYAFPAAIPLHDSGSRTPKERHVQERGRSVSEYAIA